MRSEADFDSVKRLLGRGLSDYEIARRTGVPRATVANWRHRPFRVRRAPPPPPPPDWRPTDERAYAYLLGLYLGDGCIWVPAGGHWASLRVYLDARYPLIVAEARDAFSRVVPSAPVRQHPKEGCVVLSASSSIWPVAFPQHGPGRKHTRPIELTDWQRELTARHPKALLRGLIRSDGCRCINRFTVRLPRGGARQYPRATSSRTSLPAYDIHCDLLGVRWTQSNFKSISVSDRVSVAPRLLHRSEDVARS